MHILDFAFGAMVSISLRASLVLLAVLALRWMLRRAGAVRWLDFLWLVLLVRLLVPALPGSRLSPFNWVRAPGSGLGVSPAPWYASPGFRTVTGAPASRPPAAPDPVVQGWEAYEVTFWTVSPAAAVWALGVLLVLGAACRSAVLARRVVRGSRTPMAPEVAKLGLRLPIRETDAVGSPALAGLLRPVVLAPPGLLARLAPESRAHVLLHEWGHWRRRDLWVEALFTVALALHWWNPLVWLAVRLARGDRELACDDWVLRRIGERRAADYGKTLLVVSTGRRRLLPVAMAQGEDRSGLRARIRSIAAFSRGTWRRAALATSLVAGFAFLALADEPSVPWRPLRFTPHAEVAPGDLLQAEAVWGDAATFADSRHYRVRGRYALAGCEKAVLIAEGLGAGRPVAPPDDRVKLLDCGRGTFDLSFAARAPGALAFSILNASGGQGLAGLVLAPDKVIPRPSNSVRDIRWRSAGTPALYEALSWVGKPDGVLIDLPFYRTDPVPRSRQGGDRTAVLFENRTAEVAFIHWSDFAGARRLQGFFSPGETFVAWTAVDHVFVITGERGEQLGVAAASERPGRVVIR